MAWALLAFIVAGGSIAYLVLRAQDQTLGSPLLAAFGGVCAVVFAVIAWRRRRQHSFGSAIVPMVSILAGGLSIVTGAALSGAVTVTPNTPVAAVTAAPAPAAAASAPAAAPAPSAAPVPAPAAPVREPATRMSMGETLGTLQFVLKLTRGPDGLQSPALGVTSAGGVFDPFSSTPNRILVILPANTTLSYTVSPDRHNYAVTLTDSTDPSMVARFDTVNGLVQWG